jgi:hypothetical protein
VGWLPLIRAFYDLHFAFPARSPVPTHPGATSATGQMVLQAKAGEKTTSAMKMNQARNEREIVETFQYLKCLAALVVNSKW